MNKIQIFGHRGASGHEPENTLIAFQKAIDMRCNGLELDVRLSLDNEIIVIHDDSIDRTTNGNGFVNEMKLSEIKSFLVNDQHQIPTLNEVFELLKSEITINIELKTFEVAEKVVLLIENYIKNKSFNYSNFIISSFDWHALQQVSFLNEKIQIGVLTDSNIELAFSFAKFIKAKTLNPYFKLLNQANVSKIQEKEIEIHAWTVNDFEDISLMKSLKVNAIITNYPERIK